MAAAGCSCRLTDKARQDAVTFRIVRVIVVANSLDKVPVALVEFAREVLSDRAVDREPIHRNCKYRGFPVDHLVQF